MQKDIKGMILARIPDLTELDETGDPLAVSSGGRLLSQALSFRLLGILAIVLVSVAMLQFGMGRGQSDNTPADEGLAQRLKHRPTPTHCGRLLR